MLNLVFEALLMSCGLVVLGGFINYGFKPQTIFQTFTAVDNSRIYTNFLLSLLTIFKRRLGGRIRSSS